MKIHIKSPQITFFSLAAILIVGFLVRVYRLGDENIWFDEGISIYGALFSPMYIDFPIEQNPPFYHFLLSCWIKLFGASEFSVRFPSLIFELASILLMFFIGKALFNSRAGLISAMLLSLSWFHVEYSQEARPYALMVFLSALSFYSLIKLSKERSMWNVVGYIIVTSLLMYTHTYAPFILLAQGIWIFSTVIFFRNITVYSFKSWVAIQSAVILIYLPWVFFLIEQIEWFYSSLPNFLKIPTTSSLITTFTHYSGSTVSSVLFSGILISYIYKILAKDSRNKAQLSELGGDHYAKIYLLILWILVPNLAPYVMSQIIKPIYYTRYTIGASLGLYLLIGLAIAQLKHTSVRFVLVVILAGLSFWNIGKYYREYSAKQEWKKTAELIESKVESTDVVIFTMKGLEKYVFDRYSRRNNYVKLGFPAKDISNLADNNRGELLSLMRGFHRVWIVRAHQGDDKGIIEDVVQNHLSNVETIRFRGILLYTGINNLTE